MQEFDIAAKRFSLVMPNEYSMDFKAYVSWTALLFLPPYQREGQLHALQEGLVSAAKIINRLRALRGLLPHPSGKADFTRMPDLVDKSIAELKRELGVDLPDAANTTDCAPD
ncbi:hypothetical protein IF650_00340 [Cellulosimicrobium terreum]|nr:hypothetical protein [Cellulosimicrobium terreum]